MHLRGLWVTSELAGKSQAELMSNMAVCRRGCGDSRAPVEKSQN